MVWPVSSSALCTNEPVSSTIPYGEPTLLVCCKWLVVINGCTMSSHFLNSLRSSSHPFSVPLLLHGVAGEPGSCPREF